MDIQMPQVSGIEATIDIKKMFPNTKILIQTVYEDDDKVFQAYREHIQRRRYAPPQVHRLLDVELVLE